MVFKVHEGPVAGSGRRNIDSALGRLPHGHAVTGEKMLVPDTECSVSFMRKVRAGAGKMSYVLYITLDITGEIHNTF